MTIDLKNLSDYGTHSRGVSAILCTESSPFDLLGGVRTYHLANPLLLDEPLKVWEYTFSMVLSAYRVPAPPRFQYDCAPATSSLVPSLGMLLTRFGPV